MPPRTAKTNVPVGSPTQAVRARSLFSLKKPAPQSQTTIDDEIDDDPLWPRDSDIFTKAQINTNAHSKSLINEILSLRIGLPRCNQPFLQQEENPVIMYNRLVQLKMHDSEVETQRMETAKVRLPTKTELEDYPEELKRQIVLAARLSLKTHLVPILMVRRAKIYRQQLSRSQQAEAVPPMTIETLLTRVGIMNSWPKASLESVINKMTLRAFEPNEIVAHMHEPTHEMLFLAHGIVRISNRHAKRKNYQSNINQVGALGQRAKVSSINQLVYAPSTFGEMNQLTEEPWAYYIRTQGLCYFWCLKKVDFAAILETIPSHLVMSTIHLAFQRRKEAMRINYPFSAETVLQHSPFENVSYEFAKAISDRCVPHAVPKKYTLCAEKALCDGMYFLRHGTISQHKASKPGEAETQLIISAPAALCGTELVHGSLHDTTLRTVTDCDLYFLTKASFSSLVQQYPQDVDVVLDAARAQKCEEVLDNAAMYIEIIQKMPIIKDCVSMYKLRQFLPLLKAKSYRPLTSVCSTSEFCDRIILLTKGILRLGGEHGCLLKQGESIGWTCCVPHRWSVDVMAMHVTVEVLEISQIELMNFLHAEGTLGTAVRLAEQLMFPRAHTTEIVEIPTHPVFYPISRSRIANFNEPGFSTVHMGIMTEQVRRERERRSRLQLNQPSPCRQVGNGVWFPSRKKKM